MQLGARGSSNGISGKDDGSWPWLSCIGTGRWAPCAHALSKQETNEYGIHARRGKTHDRHILCTRSCEPEPFFCCDALGADARCHQPWLQSRTRTPCTAQRCKSRPGPCMAGASHLSGEALVLNGRKRARGAASPPVGQPLRKGPRRQAGDGMPAEAAPRSCVLAVGGAGCCYGMA